MNKNRKLFVAVGLVLAVGILGIYMWYPPQGEQNAQGAIGTVAKHRTSQITAKDVVLGDEKNRSEDKIVYGHFLDDAIKLESISADLASFASGLESKSLENAKADLESLSRSLDSHSADLGQRLSSQMSATLEASSRLASRDAMAGNKALQSFNGELQSLQKSMGSQGNLEAQSALYNRFLSSRDNLESVSLQSIEADLAAMAKTLENRGALENKELQALSGDLNNISKSLESHTDLGSHDLANQVNALQAFSLEQRAMNAARDQLGSFIANSSSLENRALGSKQLEAISAALASHSAALQNQAVDNMQNRFSANLGAASRLESMKSMVESMGRNIQNRSDLGSLTQVLGSVKNSLENRSAHLENRSLGSMQAELSAISQHLDNQAALEARMASKSLDNKSLNSKSLDSKSLDNKSLDNKSLNSKSLNSKSLDSKSLDNKSLDNKSLGGFSNYLGQVSKALGSQNAGLGQKANELQNKAAGLENRAAMGSQSRY